MKSFDVCGIGNSLVDILIKISEEEFTQLGYEKGTMNLVAADEQATLIEKFKDRSQQLSSGGSLANSTIAIAQLGGKGAFTSCLADDQLGMFYQREFRDFGIEVTNPLINGAVTGTCVSLITPDSERTMRTCLGVSSALDPSHIKKEVLEQSEWVFIEGYLFANPDTGQKAIEKVIELASGCGCKIAITFSDSWVVDAFYEPVKEAANIADLIFANHVEACHFAKTESRDEAFNALCKIAPSVVMTAGAEGAYLCYQGKKSHVEAFQCQPVDLTGAGDIFAGAFLYGITHDIPPERAAKAGCYLASKVITRVGARLHSGTRDFWDESLQKA